MTSTRGPDKDPVPRGMVSDKHLGVNWFWLIPEKLQIVFLDSSSFLVRTRYIYRRKKEHEKKIFQTSGRGESEKHDNDDGEKDKNTPMAQHKGCARKWSEGAVPAQ